MNLLDKMINFLNKPYDLLESKTFRHLFVFGGAGFAFIFLWVFEPFGLYNLTTIPDKILAIGLYVGIGLLLMIFQVFPLQNLLIRKYTLGITILWLMLSFFVIGTSSSIINSILYNEGRFNFLGFIYFQGIILSINIIPVSIFVLIHYSLTLRRRLRVASNINDTLNTRDEKSENIQELVIKSENKNEAFSLSIDSLLYITTQDNYIDIYYYKNNNIEHKLIRYSLANFEGDNRSNKNVFRCHKSFIVNKGKIESISGNAAGYRIKLFDCNMLIPVSRKWNKSLSTIVS